MNAQVKIRTTLSEAIAGVMADITPLAKGENNSHGNYNFASVDDFLNLTRPICAKHKLDIRQDEESCEITSGQVFVRYAFTLHHYDEMAGPYRRSIAVNAKMGSQAFGAAQSYALKQFLRSLFQISTGEKDDIDYHKPEQLADQKPVETDTPQGRAEYPFPDGPATGISELKKLARPVWRDLMACGDADELEGCIHAHGALLDQVSRLQNPTHRRELWEGDGRDNPGLSGVIEQQRAAFAKPTILQAG